MSIPLFSALPLLDTKERSEGKPPCYLVSKCLPTLPLRQESLGSRICGHGRILTSTMVTAPSSLVLQAVCVGVKEEEEEEEGKGRHSIPAIDHTPTTMGRATYTCTCIHKRMHVITLTHTLTSTCTNTHILQTRINLPSWNLPSLFPPTPAVPPDTQVRTETEAWVVGIHFSFYLPCIYNELRFEILLH